MRVNRIVLFLSSAIFSFVGLTQVALAAPSIYYQTVYVGNEWTISGTYDDSIPEEDASDTNGEIDADSTGATTSYFTSFQFQGTIPTTAIIDISWYSFGPNGGTYIGQSQVSSTQIGQQINAPYANAWGMSFTITDTDASTPGGQVWLHETWSNATDVSSTGEVIWDTPSWATSGTTTGTTSTTSTSSTGTTVDTTVNVTVNAPPPPDWNQITTEIADKIWSQVPPIPAPPTGSDQITASNTIQQPVQTAPPDLQTPTVQTPSSPPEPGTETTDFIGGYTPINVPTSDSTPFNIQDPLANLPHAPTGSEPVPGNVGPTGYTPLVGESYPTPAPGVSAPTAPNGPTFAPPGTAPVGIMPDYTGGQSGTNGPTPTNTSNSTSATPSPASSGAIVPGYTIGAMGAAPSYTFGGGIS